MEVDRWTFTVEDFAAEKRRQLGPDAELTDSERQRVKDMIGEGSRWRQVSCPRDASHTDFLAERVADERSKHGE